MDTNALIRAVVADLLAEGLSQVTLAKRLGLSPTWFNRWVNAKDDRRLSVDAATTLLRFLRAFHTKIGQTVQDVEQALTAAAVPHDEAASPPKRTRQK